MTIEIVTSAVRGAVESYRDEAKKRREISKTDPVADTLEYIAADIAERLKEAEAASETLTVEQYARAEGVSVQTVRAWIRTHQLTATQTGKGYRIRKGERRVRRSA